MAREASPSDSDGAFSYDELPYTGSLHPGAHPARAAGVARLFGVPAAHLESARVLELGCAQGDDLIALAAAFPGARFVGIDLGRKHVEAATAIARARGLENVQFIQGDVAELDGLGRFDYVIAHGLYSWVPEFVAEAMLAMCESTLSEHGVAYISYNTFPGWEELGLARAALRAHVADIRSPREQVTAAHRFLAAFENSSADDSLTRSLRRVATRIVTATDSYLFHEFLCEDNHPVLFEDFVQRAATHRLRYVGDVTPGGMWGRTPRGEMSRIAYEQRLDHEAKRSFRRSLLCHDAVAVRTSPDPEALRSLALSTPLERRADGSFTGPDGMVLWLAGDGIVSAMTQLSAARGRPVPFAEAWCRFDDAATVVDDLLDLVHAGVVEVRAPEGPEASAVGKRPCAFAGARADLADGHACVGGLRHVTVALDPIARFLLEKLDGTRDRNDLVSALLAAMERGDLTDLARPAFVRPSREDLFAQVDAWLEHAHASGLLVS